MITPLVSAAQAKGFPIASSNWTVPVYYANASTPRYDVKLVAEWNNGRILYSVPIPANATPDPSEDGHLAIVDTSTGCEYNFWAAHRVGSAWQAYGGARLELDGSGVTTNGARAAHFGLLAGLIRPEEIKAGRIDHALVFATPMTSKAGAVAPATGGTGSSTLPGALPLGARVQLDPSLNLDALGLNPWQKTVARALQEYGMYLGDTGGALGLYAEHSRTASTPYPWGSDVFAYMPTSLVNSMRVLKLGPFVTPNYQNTASRCGTFNW